MEPLLVEQNCRPVFDMQIYGELSTVLCAAVRYVPLALSRCRLVPSATRSSSTSAQPLLLETIMFPTKDVAVLCAVCVTLCAGDRILTKLESDAGADTSATDASSFKALTSDCEVPQIQ